MRMVKDSLLSLLAHCYGRIDRRPHILVLTLHRVGSTAKITTEHVRGFFQYLNRHYTMVHPSQLEESIGHRRVAMVTIDDCHTDTYDSIYPAAMELGVPITVCVPTDFFFRGEWLWFDKLTWGLSQANAGAEVKIEGHHLIVGVPQTILIFSRFLKSVAISKREILINKVMNELGVIIPEKPVEGFQPVTEHDMREMLDSGVVEICSHTVSHPIVTRLSDEELDRELVESKRELEAFSGREVPSFCYPNGGIGDFDNRTREALKRAGYKIGFTLIEGLNRPFCTDMFAMRRIHGHHEYGIFLKLTTGLGELQVRLGLVSQSALRYTKGGVDNEYSE